MRDLAGVCAVCERSLRWRPRLRGRDEDGREVARVCSVACAEWCDLLGVVVVAAWHYASHCRTPEAFS